MVIWKKLALLCFMFSLIFSLLSAFCIILFPCVHFVFIFKPVQIVNLYFTPEPMNSIHELLTLPLLFLRLKQIQTSVNSRGLWCATKLSFSNPVADSVVIVPAVIQYLSPILDQGPYTLTSNFGLAKFSYLPFLLRLRNYATSLR